MAIGAARFAFIATLLGVLGACTAEGNSSSLLEKGEKSRFLTIQSCIDEATSTYTGGIPVYSVYVCREMFLGFWVVSTARYHEGERVDERPGGRNKDG